MRFDFWPGILTIFLASLCLGGQAGELQDQVDGHPAYQFRVKTDQETVSRTKALLRVEGTLKARSGTEQDPEESDQSQVLDTPLQVKAKLFYDERVLQCSPACNWANRTVRYYYTAEAEVKVGQKQNDVVLPTDQRVIVQDLTEQAAFYSPSGPLERDQLDLIRVPGNTTAMSGLLPEKPIREQEVWEVDHQALTVWLALKSLGYSQVQGQWISTNGNHATLQLSGNLTGALEGTTTEIELLVKCRYNLKKQYISSMVMDLKEARKASHARPGLDIVARLQLRNALVTSSQPLADRHLDGLDLTDGSQARVLTFRSKAGNFTLLQDLRWHVTYDQDKTTVFRMVDGDKFLAQCNITRLPDLPAGTQPQLEDFQQNIHQALGDHFGKFVVAKQHPTESGMDLIHVVVTGLVEKLPIQWSYYHLTHQDGRRVVYTITLESELQEKFSRADELLVNSFQFSAKSPSSNVSTSAKEQKPAEAGQQNQEDLTLSDQRGPHSRTQR
ncbi:MAG: hypothetical protein CMJ81_18505 [Planctomycetaceae bacterium]|nr:hypothetical protein [Planctomycetaceae bacterium]MBP61830.1 hypothetical protein [Planctomycetaceae bacterium]